MPSFKNKLKNMAAEKQIAVHPLVTKLNANHSTRSSYWLAFVLYAIVEEKELDARLTELGKSLKLDDAEIKDELASIKECESDEDFESLVRECANGLVDQAVKILLLVELDHFSKENSLDPDFISTLSDIIELSAEEKTFLRELKETLKAKAPDIEKISSFLKKNSDKLENTECFLINGSNNSGTNKLPADGNKNRERERMLINDEIEATDENIIIKLNQMNKNEEEFVVISNEEGDQFIQSCCEDKNYILEYRKDNKLFETSCKNIKQIRDAMFKFCRQDFSFVDEHNWILVETFN